MKTLTHPQLSKHLVEILKEVSLGEEIVIKSDETQKNAILIPYVKYKEQKKLLFKK